ncbi:MAG: DUF1883 domain-containing protein [Vicingaceae bacterium]
MKILQQAVKVKRGSRVIITFSKPTTVYLMTEVNFKRYKDGSSFRRLGGKYDQSPVEFTAPYDGTWHAVIERGSHYNPISIEGSVEVLSPKRKEIPYFEENESSQASDPIGVMEEESPESEPEEERENDQVDDADESEEEGEDKD